MKIAFFIFITFTISYAISYGQDSLYSKWQDANSSDSVRIHSMNQYINSVWNSNAKITTDSAITLTKELEDFSKEKENYRGIAYAMNNRILAYGLKGNLTKSEEIFAKCLSICKENKLPKEEATAYYNIAISYYLKNNYDKSIDNYKKSLAIQRKLNNQSDIVGTLSNIGSVYYTKGSYVDALLYFEDALEFSQNSESQSSLGSIYNNIALIYKEFGNVAKSIKFLKKSLYIKEKNGNKIGLAASFHNIGNYYEEIDDFKNAMEYYNKSLKLETQIGNKRGIGESLNSIGDIYFTQKKYEKALDKYQKSKSIFESLGDQKWVSMVLNNISKIYTEQGMFIKADSLLQKSLSILKSMDNKKELGNTYKNVGFNSIGMKSYSKAIINCETALELADNNDFFELQKESCECLYKAYKSSNNITKALKYYEKMSEYDTQLMNREIGKKLYQMEYEKQKLSDSLLLEKRRIETKLAYEEKLSNENQKRNIAIAVGFILLIIVGGLFSRVRYIRKSKLILEKEKDLSENLLLNILPSEIAKELKEKGKSEARDYDNVTVLFTDFKEFTQTSEKHSAINLIDEVNHCFLQFDMICEKYNIEKIKTIGDSYMAVGGLPLLFTDSTTNTVLAAIEMCDFIIKRKLEKEDESQLAFEMRIGIHTGSVVAGIVGIKKFQYDIWGDTVNTASRMESSGVVGKVNISQGTYERIKDDTRFEFTPRGKVLAKGKGEVEMFFVNRKTRIDE